jgi:HD-GYP domain-containing protein (c-di-GMP phosphodiesterase class II)
MIRGTADTLASGIVARLIEVVRLRDPALADHGQRAAHIAAAVAEQMGCSEDEVDLTYLGAQLHDIGKLGVTEAVLWKPAGLTPVEWAQIRTHPEKGHRLVAEVVHPDVAAGVLSHHERLDGMGYPNGVAALTLPLLVRIVQVADAFDAITSERPYQSALSSEFALAEITRCAGTQFDPDVVTALGQLLGDDIDLGGIIDLEGDDGAGPSSPADPFAATA